MIFLLPVQTGCQHLQPLSLPDENALAPTQAPLWDSLGEAQPDDWVALLNPVDYKIVADLPPPSPTSLRKMHGAWNSMTAIVCTGGRTIWSSSGNPEQRDYNDSSPGS